MSKQSQKNKKVDDYLKTVKTWSLEIQLLRQMALDSGLVEDFKWRLPCYSKNDQNVVIIQSFKNFCALMFFKGHLLKDPKSLLKAPGENSQTARRLGLQLNLILRQLSSHSFCMKLLHGLKGIFNLL